MRSRLSLLLASVTMTAVFGMTCGGQGVAQTVQGQAGAQGQNGAPGKPAAAAPNPYGPNPYTPSPSGANPYTANPGQIQVPDGTGPYTGNKAGFYESGGPNAANAQKWAPQPPQFKSLYPKADPDNPGAEDNPDADNGVGADMAQQGLGGLGGDTKEGAADTSHSLTYFTPKSYYWCRGQDPNSANIYYSDTLVESQAEYEPDYYKQFADFVRGKYGVDLESPECISADDVYAAKSDADHRRSSDQFRNKTVVNTLWTGKATP